MMTSQDGFSRTEDDLLQPPDQTRGSTWNRQRQSSPACKLGMTRKEKDTRDFKENENPEEKEKRHKEQELKSLYKELLYTITHKLGKPASAEVFTDNQLHQYIREAFSMAVDEHQHLTERVQNTKPPVYCLMATVKEAKGILGKDVSGFSDPYCLLTILEDEKESRTRQSRPKPRKAVVKDAVSDEKVYTTDTKKQTLNPIWNQTFVLEFEDTAVASFHIEMWDKDEELSLAQKLEEIRTNFHGLRRMIKDAKKEKGQDDYLGSIVLRLEDLHCTEDNWYVLEPRTETYPDRGQCHLQLKFIHKERDGTLSAGRSAYVNYCGILLQFVQSHISKQQVIHLPQGSVPWKGELCGEGQTLLDLYATQCNLSPFLQDLAKWMAYSKLYQSLEVDSSVLLQQLTSIEYHWHQQDLPYQQKQELGESLHGFLQYGLCLVAKYRDIFPPTQDATPRLHRLLRILSQVCKTQAFQKLNAAQFDLHDEVNKAVHSGTQEWFAIKKGLYQPMTKDLTETVSALSRLVGEVQQDIKHNKDIWNRVFVSAVQVDVFTVVYQKLDFLLAGEVRDTLSLLEGEMEQNLANSLFPLYLSLQVIHKDKAFLQKRGKLLELTNFHEGFREALPYWLNKAFSTTQDRVERAVQVDQLQPLQSGPVPIKHSSSAVDLVTCVQPICQLWEQLSWPDPEEAFMLMVKLTVDVCKIVMNYCRILKERVRELSENSDPGRAVNMLNSDIAMYVRSMSTRCRIPSKSTEEAVVPLIKYLERELQYMNENLVQENFNRYSLLTPLWTNSIRTLYQVATQQKQEDGLMVFCQRLQFTLQCLEQCFHAEGNGLPLDTLHVDSYKILKAHLTHNSLNCQQLIEKFLDRKVWEQKVYSGEKYGAVTLLASYRRSDHRLRVEVLNAANLQPMDSNGSSDPFVQLRLEPGHVFSEVEPRTTQIKNCDLNPLFDEAFEFLVSVEQCQAAGACLVVTVLDYDTLTTDDFEGEAFLALKAVPGVGGGSGDREGHQPDPSPAQIRLPLMHPKPNDDSILKLLESRRGEREAQLFVKKRRQRERQSQEGKQ
ncbi:protein unc-13 homolog D-like isoform X6 [Oncorhynchus masou masou]|uniref:protein unc-13 homolog D-like isoform X6 n=1 Tax=Oncorhynchus masou masou TaxID=90313 RepID=UPI003182FE1B